MMGCSRCFPPFSSRFNLAAEESFLLSWYDYDLSVLESFLFDSGSAHVCFSVSPCVRGQ